MNPDRYSIARTLLPAARLRRAGSLALWGALVAFAPVAPANPQAQKAAPVIIPETYPASRQSPRVERADEASLASGTIESQADVSRSRAAVGVVGVAEVESPRTALIEAATDDAADRLYEQIAAEPAGRGHRVADILEALPALARAEFRTALRRSAQIGGPRFADVRTTQVQLEAHSGEVGQVLVELVAGHSEQSPVTPEELAQAVERWSKRSFFGFGGSVRPEVAELLRPKYTRTESNAWSAVDADTTRAAILAAHSDAVEQVVERMSRVVVVDDLSAADGPSAASTDETSSDAPDEASGAPGESETDEQQYTLGQLVVARGAEADLRTWLADRPIKRVRFGDDRQVIIHISVGADDIVTYLAQRRESDGAQFTVSAPISPPISPLISPEQWQVAESRLADALPESIAGQAFAKLQVAADEAPQAPRLATAAPDWTRRPITATGAAAGSANQLLLGLKADANARENLRQTLLELPVGEDITVADLVEHRPEVGELLDDVVRDARISRSEYPTRSDATVHISISSIRFWHLLTR